ncbi:hypothetical protein [Nocardiopsis halotolerans]|uniref:hypothetical protein n=1 Tax=Nocardiopsis halotolerans TaxID=124252 RepID=UPI001360B17D|nr:hypothetical protein [Nocardiopsis halotolerans]
MRQARTDVVDNDTALRNEGLTLPIAWLGSYRRPNVRWERTASTFLAMLGTACTLICYKHLAKHSDDF